MRVFIAVDLPQSIKEYLRSIQAAIKEKKLGKMTFVHDFHMTLKFLGEVEEQKVEMMKTGLSKISFEAFRAYIDGAGTFPGEHYIRVAWIGLEPEEKIKELQTKVDVAMFKLGFQMEKDFNPHLTLARVKYMDDEKKELFVNIMRSLKIERKEFKADKIKLIKSTLTSKGPIYETLAECDAN